MIISHKHKFIFLKAKKTAGTSMEIALAKYCGNEDILTRNYYSKSFDSTLFHPVTNYNDAYYDHTPPDEIKKLVGKEIWDSYFKFTVVRNPWDQQVSMFHWRESERRQFEKHRKTNMAYYVKRLLNPRCYIEFYQKYLRKTESENDRFHELIQDSQAGNNTNFYFDDQGNPICDYYIRYENLEEDYGKVCNKLGIPHEKLPLTKDKFRKHDKHYSEYYDDNSMLMVAVKFKKEVEYFNYKFERVCTGAKMM